VPTIWKTGCATRRPTSLLSSSSPAVRSVLQVVGRAAQAEVAVLFRGESGTGKGVLARAMHEQSKRRERPFVVVNCPTLSEELLASELFGHAKGAFTGAVRDQPGRVESAQGGTLFLDEIGEMPANLQAKLLRFLQDKQFERVGETRTRQADVRVAAATNRNLDADVKTGAFREDLLYRLNVIEIQFPPCANGPRTFFPWRGTFWSSLRERLGARCPSFPPPPNRCWPATPGRATCASCATPSNAP
jgi:NtrC-family two-component system response regulator AlgB